MAGFQFSFLSNALNEVQGTGVSFQSQAKKWETEEQAKEITDAIDNCKSLEYLNLEGNTLGVDAARGIGKALEKHPEFKQALFKDLFTGRLKTEIPLALEAMGKGMITAGAHLTVLDCSDNALGPNGMVGLVELLKSPACYSLQELKLNNCGLGIGGGEMLAKALLSGYHSSVAANQPMKLKTFIAGRNRLENNGATALAGFFEIVKTLEHVAMPQNGIYHPGISALSEGFKQNPNMTVLNLNDNTIGPIGALSIADALQSMQKLREINFGDCLLKTRGAVIISEAIQDGHMALETLILEANEIGPNGGCSIASAMGNKELLTTLSLDCNQFGEEGRDALIDILEEFQRARALGPLDEDDSDGEDEDDDDVGDGEDEDDYVSEDADEREYYQGDESTNSNIETLNWSLNTTTAASNASISFLNASPNSVETILLAPHLTQQQLNDLDEPDKLQAIRDYLESLSDDDHIIFMVFAVLKFSALASTSNEAADISIELYKDCYAYAEKTNQTSRVNDFFLTQLGLLKSEDKTFKPEYDITSCRIALQKAIKANAFPDTVRAMYSCFLGDNK